MPIHFTMGERPAFSLRLFAAGGLRRWIKYPVPLSIKKIYLRSPFSSGWALCFILLRPAWKRSSLPGAGETEPSGLRTAMSRGKNSRTRTTTPRRVSIAAYTMPLASCPTARPTRMRPASIVPGESWLMAPRRTRLRRSAGRFAYRSVQNSKGTDFCLSSTAHLSFCLFAFWTDERPLSSRAREKLRVFAESANLCYAASATGAPRRFPRPPGRRFPRQRAARLRALQWLPAEFRSPGINQALPGGYSPAACAAIRPAAWASGMRSMGASAAWRGRMRGTPYTGAKSAGASFPSGKRRSASSNLAKEAGVSHTVAMQTTSPCAAHFHVHAHLAQQPRSVKSREAAAGNVHYDAGGIVHARTGETG